MIKLNLGSHSKDIGDDWINIDGLDIPNVDAICDLNNTPFVFKIKKIDKFKEVIPKSWIDSFNKGELRGYPFGANSIDKVQMIEVLEHLSWRKTYPVLSEIRRILKPGGELEIQVPDCGKAMEYYVNNEVCECVPHKGTAEEYKPDENCFLCSGKGKINPNRWLFSFLGAQKHEFDSHLNIFTKERLENDLKKAGFTNYEFTDDIYKLKVKAIK